MIIQRVAVCFNASAQTSDDLSIYCSSTRMKRCSSGESETPIEYEVVEPSDGQDASVEVQSFRSLDDWMVKT